MLSYLPREAVDGRFKVAIDSDHHIVVYGSSKQGKTALRQTHIPVDQCVVVRCGPSTEPRTIYSSLLRQANVTIETVETSEVTIDGQVKAKLGFRAQIPWFGGADSKVETKVGGSHQLSLRKEFIAFDFDDAQSVGELLQAVRFSKFVVLENFHYLPTEVQRRLAFDLRTFHEINIRFVILGIWKEANHIMVHNPDLQDRIVEIPVEPWNADDFLAVARSGCKSLNIEIARSDIDVFVANSFGNIGMFQEFLRAYCELSGIDQAVTGLTARLDSKELANHTLSSKLDSQKSQLLKTLQSIAARSRVRSDEGDPLLLPYYLARLICRLDVAELQQGINKNRLLELLRTLHHRVDKDTIRIGDVTNLLQRLPSIQKDFQSPLLYFDGTLRCLRFVDSRHLFVLANANRSELEEDIPYPRDSSE